MTNHITPFISLVIISFLLALSACTNDSNNSASDQVVSKRAGVNEVIIHESGNPDKLNPYTSTSANSSFIEEKMFLSLLDIDPIDFSYRPILVVSRPKIDLIDDGEYAGGLSIAYEIRPEANWDNGTPVTGYDVDFTLKMIKNPQVDCPQVRPYFEFINDIKIDSENPKKFTFYCKGRYFMSEIWSSVTPYPEYLYDPKQIMRNFTVKQLNDANLIPKLKGDPKIISFAEDFNSEKYQRDPNYVSGSGPYELVEFITSQRVILKRKDNWWGQPLVGKVDGFNNFPEKMTYEILPDATTAVTALKDEQLDVLYSFKSKDFVELRDDKSAEGFRKLYNMASPTELSYIYIGLNTKNPKLQDKRVRKALALSLDKEYVRDVLFYGLGEPTVGPVHPTKPYYNKNIKPYEFNIEEAKKLLDEAGWVDSDGDGIRDKMIDGKKVPLRLEFKHSQGSATGSNIGLMLKKHGEQVGFDIEITSREWTVFIDDNKSHKFEMFYGAWIAAPTLNDLKQIWHTQSYNGGSNYVGFGNKESDDLIEAIRYELDEDKRNEMYFKIQEIIHEEVPYIFMLTPKNKLAIHRRFDNAEPKLARPGFVAEEFVLNPNFGVKAIANK